VNSNKYSVRFLSVAEHDLQELITYIATENVTAALVLLEKIHKECLKLGVHPYLGKVPHEEKLIKLGYRVLVVENYLIFYKVKGKTVLIHRVIHGARDLINLLKG